MDTQIDYRSLLVVGLIVLVVLLMRRADRVREQKRERIRTVFAELGDLFAQELVAE